jgi:hypothetical protein
METYKIYIYLASNSEGERFRAFDDRDLCIAYCKDHNWGWIEILMIKKV